MSITQKLGHLQQLIDFTKTKNTVDHKRKNDRMSETAREKKQQQKREKEKKRKMTKQDNDPSRT